MSGVPCKYYMQNACRFGDNCRFYHPRDVGNSSSGGFGVRPSQFGQNQSQQDQSARNQQNVAAMIDMVKKDMQEWENCKIFPFSSYGPGSKPCVPGFEEISAEELRYRYIQNNKMPLDLSRELSQLQQTRASYKELTPLTKNILERVIVNGERISSETVALGTSNQPGSVFGGGGTSLFGSANASSALRAPVFGGSGTGAGGSSIFGNTSSSWGATATSPVFSQQNQQSSGTGGGLFGQTSSSVFGNTAAPSTLQVQQQPSAFGQNQPFQTTTSPFQQPSLLQGMLQTPQTNNAFGSNPQQQQQAAGSTFGAQPLTTPQTGTIFGGTTPGQQVGSIFGGSAIPQAQASGSLFGGSQPQPLAPQTTGSIFGGPQLQPQTQSPQQGNLFGVGIASNQNQGIQQAGSIFGAPQNTQAPAVLQPQPASIFGAPSLNQQSTQQQQPGSLFGTMPAPAPTPTGSFFGAPQNSSVQLQPQPQAVPQDMPTTTGSLFGTQLNPPAPATTGGGTFGSLTTGGSSPGLFGNPVMTPQSHTGSLFGSAISQTPQTQSQPDQKYVYTDEAELTPEEIEAFNAPNFTIDNIPVRPPPRSYCV